MPSSSIFLNQTAYFLVSEVVAVAKSVTGTWVKNPENMAPTRLNWHVNPASSAAFFIPAASLADFLSVLHKQRAGLKLLD